MALDSRQKRAAVIGVGRAWYRNPNPGGVDAAQRASIGQVYPVAVFQDVVVLFVPASRAYIVAAENRTEIIEAETRVEYVAAERKHETIR